MPQKTKNVIQVKKCSPQSPDFSQILLNFYTNKNWIIQCGVKVKENEGEKRKIRMNETAKIIFGLVGGLAMFLFVFIIPLFAKFVQFISPKGNEVFAERIRQ